MIIHRKLEIKLSLDQRVSAKFEQGYAIDRNCCGELGRENIGLVVDHKF